MRPKEDICVALARAAGGSSEAVAGVRRRDGVIFAAGSPAYAHGRTKECERRRHAPQRPPARGVALSCAMRRLTRLCCSGEREAGRVRRCSKMARA